MMKCIVVGRVIPERANVRFGPAKISFDGAEVKGDATAYVEFSQISVAMSFDRKYTNLHNISAIAKAIVLPLTNYIAFSLVGAYDVVMDMIVDSDEGRHYAIAVTEPVFDVSAQPAQTFKCAEEHSNIRIPDAAINDRAAARALEELSNALKRPHLTPMYCRIAIETVRSSFDSEERTGWEKLRATLNIRRETIDEFWSMAAEQRHGKLIPLDWDNRKSCLRIAWEITNRYLIFRRGESVSFAAF